MKAKRFLSSGAIAAVFLMLLTGLAFSQAPDATPLGTGFTYQGELLSSGTPYSGTCDFQFGLYDAATMGTAVGELSVPGVTVAEGIFTTQLDFGSDKFTGDNRWLEIWVRCPAGGGTYQQLLPRQALTAAPYALYAHNAGYATDALYASSAAAVPWTGITGIPGGFADGLDNDTTYTEGYGLTLTGGVFSVNTADIQERVDGVCGTGYAIRTINQNGTVECEPVAGSGGDITGVIAGTGLTGGGFSGDVTLSADKDYLQRRVSDSCTAGSYIRAIASDGTVTCETDDNTIYSDGMGLDLTGTTFSVDTTLIQERVDGICGTGFAIRIIDTDGSVTCEPTDRTSWSLLGNAGTRSGTNFLGTTDGEALEIKVNNARVFRFEPYTVSPNLIGGHYSNWITDSVFGATISGGGDEFSPNRVTDNFGTITGGMDNLAGNDDTSVTNAYFATVSGGFYNQAINESSTIGGGVWNLANGLASTISGGSENEAEGSHSSIVGGGLNHGMGDYSTVSGGYDNTGGGNYSTISGGETNYANGIYSTVGGGSSNMAVGDVSTVSGGSSNIASGQFATIPGGSNNTASGDYSFAAGYQAIAQHPGSFVWADFQGSVFSSSYDNTFSIRAANGVWISADNADYAGEYVINSASGASAGQGTAILGRTFSDYGYGIAGWNRNSGVGVGAWSYGGNLIEAYDGDFPGGVLRFYVDNAGNVHYDGTASTFAEIPSTTGIGSSYVSLYGISAAEAWYEDLGSANLVNGKVTIVIDPLFAQTVSLSQEYQVQVTATCSEPVL